MSYTTSRPPPPDITIEATARTIYKQAVGYGFTLTDFVRFTNLLLEIAMAPEDAGVPSSRRFPRAAGPGERPPTEPPLPPRRRVHARHQELPLVGARVTIRRFGEPGDRAALGRWVDDKEGRFFLLSAASGRSHDLDTLLRSEDNVLGMVLYEGQPAGCVAFVDLDAGQRRAELRKLIGEPGLRNRGLGREAAELWVGYGLGALSLQKIYLNTLATHFHNIQINEEIGFRVEGILRNEVRIDGEPRDVLRMGLWEE